MRDGPRRRLANTGLRRELDLRVGANGLAVDILLVCSALGLFWSAVNIYRQKSGVKERRTRELDWDLPSFHACLELPIRVLLQLVSGA